VKFLIFTIVVVGVVSSIDNAPLCGVIRDGDADVDLDVQFHDNKISASWAGFEDGKERNRVLKYEWAIVSESMMTAEMKENNCRDFSGLIGRPDVMGWTLTDKTRVSANIELVRGNTYFVLVRATTALGKQTYSNSDGIFVSYDLPAAPKTAEKFERSDEGIHSLMQRNHVAIEGDCPIDQANRCADNQVSVNEYLTAIYGPADFAKPTAKAGQVALGGSSTAVFAIPPPGFAVYASDVRQPKKNNDDDDDDHIESELGPGGAIGIAIAIVGTVFFLFAIFVLVASFFGSKENRDNFKTNIRRSEATEEF